MAKRAAKLEDPDLASVLHEAMLGGALSLGDSVKYLRARDGLTQAELAQRVGVAVKVIKTIENGEGNPTLESLNRIASFIGLKVGFIEPRPTVMLSGLRDHLESQVQSRRAELSAVNRKQLSSKKRHATNALAGSDFTIELPSIE